MSAEESLETLRGGMHNIATLFRLAADDVDALADDLESLTLGDVLTRIDTAMNQTAKAIENVYLGAWDTE